MGRPGVRGVHITEEGRRPIPNQLQAFLNHPSVVGFVYVSFGSCIHVSQFPSWVPRTVLAAMGNCSHLKFVWRWDGKPPNLYSEKVPPNVYFSDLLTQLDLLAHSDIRGMMVGHGGHNGIQEALFFRVRRILDVWATSFGLVVLQMDSVTCSRRCCCRCYLANERIYHVFFISYWFQQETKPKNQNLSWHFHYNKNLGLRSLVMQQLYIIMPV